MFKKMLESRVGFTASSYWVTFCGLLREVALLSVLSPAQMGVWRAIITIQTYSKYGALNYPSVLIYRGRPKYLVESYLSMLIPLIFLLAFFTLPMLMALAWLSVGDIGGIGVYALIFSIIFVTCLNHILNSISMSIDKIGSVSLYQFVTPLLFLVGLLILPDYSIGSLLVLLLVSMLSSCVIYKDSILVLFSSIRRDGVSKIKRSIKCWSLHKFNFSTLVASISFTLFFSSEIWLIQYFAGNEYLGYFSVVVVFVNMATMAAASIVAFIFAKESSKIKSNRSYLNSLSIKLFLATTLISVVGCFLLDELVRLFFTEYSPSMVMLFTYVICIPFLALRNTTLTSMLANGWGGYSGFWTFALLVIKVFVSSVLYELGGIELMMWSLVMLNIIYGLKCVFMSNLCLMRKV